MSNLNQARRRFQIKIAQKQDTSDATAALLGLGDGTVSVPNQPGQVYIRVGNQENFGTAYNDRAPNTDNLPVFVGYDPVTDPERRIFQVLSIRQSAYVGAGLPVTPSIGAHGPTHQFGGGDDVYVQWRRLMGLRVGRPVLFVVTVDPGYIYRGTSWIAAPVGATTVDLTAQHTALGGTQAQYVLISLTSTGAISVLPAGTIKSSPANLLISDIPTPPAGNIPLAAIRLYKTQTYIGDSPAEPDIIDLRFPTYASMNNGGVAGLDKQIQFNDGGVFGAHADVTFDKALEKLRFGASTSPASVSGGAGIYAIGDGRAFGFTTETYGANTPFISGAAATGSVALPTAALSGRVLMRVSGRGYGTTDFPAASRARIDLVTAQDQTDAEQGTRIEFYTTPIASIIPALHAQIDSTGIISAAKLFTNSTGSLEVTAAKTFKVEDDMTILPTGAADTNVLAYDVGTGKWIPAAATPGGSAWLLAGNAGTNPAVNFLGTTDAQPLIIKTNSLEVGYIAVSTAIAGNARGPNALEFMTSRINATEIASGDTASIFGGTRNTASGLGATIVGGATNIASGAVATVIGGTLNTASGGYATIIGSVSSAASGVGPAIIIGGDTNAASAIGAAVIGGSNNTADGIYSFAFGYRAKTNSKNGTWIWADYNTFDFLASAANEFAARATGGVRFVTAIDGAGAATYQATVGTTAIITAKKIGAAGIALDTNGATGDFDLSLSPTNLTANRRVTFPDAALTFSGGGTLALAGFTLTVPATGTAVIGGGAGANTRVAYWTDANTLSSDAGVTLDAANNAVGVDGVKFPAVQAPSADANTLDDYEENTVTVTLTCGTSGTITLKATHQTLAYTKIGRAVTVTGYIKVDSVASPVGALILNGLPFTCVNGNAYYAASGTYGNLLAATATTSIVSFVVPNTTTMQIYKYAAGSVAVLAGDVQASSEFVINATYFTT